MAVKTFQLNFRTRGDGHTLDITDVTSRTLTDCRRQLLLGTWQQIILVDFDNRPHERAVVAQVMGE